MIVKEVDNASPLLFHACCNNEAFSTATLSFARPTSTGKETVYQTIELTNGTISNIGYAPHHRVKRCESITLVYEELAVNGLENGIIPRSLLG